MKFRRSLVRGFAPVAVFAVIGTGLVMSQTESADLDVRATPAQVRQEAVTTTAPADRRTVEVSRVEVDDDHEGHDAEGSDHTVLQQRSIVAEMAQTDLKPFSMLGVTWKSGLDAAETVVQVRWRADGVWTDWTGVDVDPSQEGTPGTEPQWVDRADAAAVRVLSTEGAKPTGVALSTIDPGKTPQVTTAASSVAQPKIISRASWGASNAGSCDSPIYGSSTKGVVIHHTAGSNSYSAAQSASIVKATQAYHTGSRNWCDIGYNFLVDKYGQIFEGRKGGITKSVRAAHSGNGTVNEQTAGISLMGTFDSTSPTSAMKTAVTNLAAWKLSLHGVPATGTYKIGGVTLNRIAGHRNVVSTACPGAKVYAWLSASGGLRDSVKARMAASDISTASPSGLKTTAQGTDSVSLAWNEVKGAPRYRVQYSTSPTWSNAVYVRSYETSLKISGLKAGTKYYFRVRTIQDDGTNISLYSGEINASTAAAAAAGSAADDNVTVPSSRVVSFKGHGYGHGIGMSQYGAEGAARAGLAYSKILSTYYPGTALSSTSGSMRVLLSSDTTDSVMVAGGSGLTFRNLVSNKTIKLPTTVGGKAVVRWSIDPDSSDKKKSALRYRTGSTWLVYNKTVWTGAAQFEGSVLSLVMPSGPDVKYRSALRSSPPKSGATNRDTVNVLSVEDYVRGVVAREMPSSWSAEALKAQSVAARTYGVKSRTSSRYYDICDTTSCQVYGGVAAETSTTDAAIKGTAGKILTYGGSPALAQFSSSSGGTTAAGSQPYLKVVTDKYDGWSGNKNHSWTISVKASTIEKSYSSIGSLKSMKITKRTGGGSYGGRVSSVTLVGSKKSVTITGNDARWGFGLRSNWFAF